MGSRDIKANLIREWRLHCLEPLGNIWNGRLARYDSAFRSINISSRPCYMWGWGPKLVQAWACLRCSGAAKGKTGSIFLRKFPGEWKSSIYTDSQARFSPVHCRDSNRWQGYYCRQFRRWVYTHCKVNRTGGIMQETEQRIKEVLFGDSSARWRELLHSHCAFFVSFAVEILNFTEAEGINIVQ